MWAADLNVREDAVFDWKMSRPAVGFCVILSGNSRHAVPNEIRGKRTVECKPGQNAIDIYRTERSLIHLTGGQEHRAVEVQIDCEETYSLLNEWQVPHSGSFRRLLQKLAEPPAGLVMNLSPILESAAYQVINCTLTGPSRRLFMESKALEILAHHLAAFSEEENSGDGDVPRGDLGRLNQAREILTQEYADPPSLIQLAHRVGLNEFKLKRGFRGAFGTTVYGYVRSQRMHKARALLETGDGTVTDAAMAVGYSCCGHFSAAFRKQFGILPRDVKRAGSQSK